MNNFDLNTNENSIDSVLDSFETYLFSKLNVMRIGVIKEILENNKVICSIANKRLIKENIDGSKQWGEYPPIYAEVWFLGCGGSGINHSLSVGSPCLLLFNDREITSYLNSGEILPLEDYRMHSLSDCIAIPFYRPTEKLKEKIVIKATNVEITGELTINNQKYKEHIHSNGNDGANTGGVVAQ